MKINKIELNWTDLNAIIFLWWFFCLRWDQEPIFLYELSNRRGDKDVEGEG